MNRPALLGLIGLVILCLLCLWCRAPAIENDVLEAALACASDAGLDPEQVSVSGRDVTLSGPVQNQKTHDLVTSCIAAFSGTRTIVDNLEVLLSGSLSFRTNYDEVTIAGVVPTATAKTAIVTTAENLWGAENVSDQTEIDAGRTIGGWSDDDFAQFLAVLQHSRRDLDIELTGGQAIVGGTVLSNLARVRVLGATVALLPGFEVVDQLMIRDPQTPREILQVTLDNLLDGKVVEFELDSAELTGAGQDVLGQVVAILKRNPGRVEISGHTDSTGAADHNQDLSRRRAEAVEQYLYANGIDPGRLVSTGYGVARPIASNATVEGQSSNRRTEFHALKEN